MGALEALANLISLQISLSVWQIVIFVGVVTYFVVTARLKYSLLATFLFIIYWMFYISWPQLLVVAAGHSVGIITYIAFGFALAGLAVYAFFFFGESKDATGAVHYGMRRVEKNILRRMDKLEGIVLQSEGKASRQVPWLEELKNKFETRLGPLEDRLRGMDDFLQGREAPLRDLEHNLKARIDALESDLIEKGGLLASGGANLEGLKAEAESRHATLQAQLQEKDEQIRHRQIELDELRSGLTARVRSLEDDLRHKEGMLEEKKVELQRLSARMEEKVAELRGVIQQGEKAASAHEAALKQLSEKLSGKIADLEQKLAEKDGLLEARNREIEELETAARQRVGELEAVVREKEAKLEHVETQRWQSAERAAAAGDAQTQLSGKIIELENRLAEKEGLLVARSRELKEVTAEARQRIAELEAGLRQKGQAPAETDRKSKELEQAVRQLNDKLAQAEAELAKRGQALAAMESARKETEGSSQAKIGLLEAQLREKAAELEAARRERGAKHAPAASAASPEGVDARIRELENQLSKKEGLLVERGRQIKELQADMKARIEDLEAKLKAKGSGVSAGAARPQAGDGEAGQKVLELEHLLAQKEELLQLKTQEISELQASVRERITELMSDIEKREELIRLNDYAAKEVEQTLRARIRDLELELASEEESGGGSRQRKGRDRKADSDYAKVINISDRSEQEEAPRGKKGRLTPYQADGGSKR